MNFNELLKTVENWPWFEFELYDNTMLRWVIALGVVLLAALLMWAVKSVLERRASRFAETTRTQWDDGFVRALQATRKWLMFVAALYCGTLVLALPERPRGVIESVAIIALVLQCGFWGGVLLEFGLKRYTAVRLENDAAAATTVAALTFLGKVALWSIVLLLALDNMGVDVTAMVAGLGVGGVAVALASQNILGDLFASLSIVLDKPFVLGDFIIVGDDMGTVENIGLKTTRVRSLSGEQLVFSNNDLLQSRIRNFKRMAERRIVFSFGVTYETPYEKLEQIPGVVREIIESQETVRFDRSHFKAYGDSALNFENVYYVLAPDYNVYMDVQQAVNLALYRRFEEQGIEFAYPTRRVLVERSVEEAAGARP